MKVTAVNALIDYFSQSMRILCTLIIVIWPALSALHGQGLNLSDYSDDTAQVNSVWDTWSVRVFAAQKSYRFSVVDADSETRTRFTPNNRFSVGVGMTYKWISLDAGINIRPRGEERTRRLDLSLTLAFNRNVMEITFQRYKGFDAEDGEGAEYGFRSDITTRHFGFSFIRAQPKRMLSLKGLTSGMHVSKKSTGVFGYGDRKSVV